MKRTPALLVTPLLVVLAVLASLVVSSPASATASTEKAQRRLNSLGCNAGPVDGKLGEWTRSAVIRFQSRHHLAQTGGLTTTTRAKLYADSARRCDTRPVPAGSGTGKRIVISQRQNWVWLVRANGTVRAQGGIVDNPGELGRGSYHVGSYCGRAARIERNSSGEVWLDNFVRFAACGFGFHRIPTAMSNGAQIHPDWMLGTNLRESHGCIRLSNGLSEKVWDFTAGGGTKVRVV
jgi:peptidoglycan hydrolase-like protein with peptidoglycan-binding domain